MQEKHLQIPLKGLKKNLEEGRGFKLMDITNKKQGGVFEFASSNELWRASLDSIDFMPLASANYSGGIIITDWYSEGASNEAVKITIRFLSNEIRSDSLLIKIYYRINMSVELFFFLKILNHNYKFNHYVQKLKL